MEFLPTSSSTCIRTFGDLFGWGDPGAAFAAVIQLGTEAVVITHFAKGTDRIISHWFRSLPLAGRDHLPPPDLDTRMGWIVISGTIPIDMLGLLFRDAIKTELCSLYIITAALVLFAAILGWIDRGSAHTKHLDEMTLGDDILVGFGQAMVLIPGVSRSGGTITAGLPLGYTRETAARVPFLLAIPTVILSGFFRLAKNFDTASLATGSTVLTTVVSFIVGYAVIVQFLKLTPTRSYVPFVVYRVVLATVVASLLVGGVVYVY